MHVDMDELPVSKSSLPGFASIMMNIGNLAIPDGRIQSFPSVGSTFPFASNEIHPFCSKFSEEPLRENHHASSTSILTTSSPPSYSPSQAHTSPKLKLKLRLKLKPRLKLKLSEPQRLDPPPPKLFSHTPKLSSRKRRFLALNISMEDDTDSEIELIPKHRSMRDHRVLRTRRCAHTRIKAKRYTHHDESSDGEDTVSDTPNGQKSDMSNAPHLSLMLPLMKRNQRILNPKNPKHRKLIARATKVGPEYYDSDAEDQPGDVRDTTKPHLFRNVNWGTYATDEINDAEFPTRPDFTQFVPGRFELQPDGTVADQKAKLIVKLTDINGRKRIFANPPPKDWNNQEAISALNKRTVQQIRRNTPVRFREVVHAYVQEERRWILANLINGKPTAGWKDLVTRFNKRFGGKLVRGTDGPRPFRTLSSLTKEIERFSAMYASGQVPMSVSTAS